jgi:hypothetical protein
MRYQTPHRQSRSSPHCSGVLLGVGKGVDVDVERIDALARQRAAERLAFECLQVRCKFHCPPSGTRRVRQDRRSGRCCRACIEAMRVWLKPLRVQLERLRFNQVGRLRGYSRSAPRATCGLPRSVQPGQFVAVPDIDAAEGQRGVVDAAARRGLRARGMGNSRPGSYWSP